MHHLVFGISLRIHFVSLASLVLIHLLFHLSNHLCHLHHSQHPSLLHSFTLGSKPTFSINPSHLNTSYPWTAFTDHGTGSDLSCSSVYFSLYLIISFCLIPCGRLRWLPSAFGCTLNTQYRIVSYYALATLLPTSLRLCHR